MQGKPLEGFQQTSGVMCLTILKAYFGCCVVNEAGEQRKAGRSVQGGCLWAGDSGDGPVGGHRGGEKWVDERWNLEIL